MLGKTGKLRWQRLGLVQATASENGQLANAPGHFVAKTARFPYGTDFLMGITTPGLLDKQPAATRSCFVNEGVQWQRGTSHALHLRRCRSRPCTHRTLPPSSSPTLPQPTSELGQVPGTVP